MHWCVMLLRQSNDSLTDLAQVGEIIAEPWDLSAQLFEAVLVENYRDEDGAVCAVIARG